jgi:hypothetical protein
MMGFDTVLIRFGTIQEIPGCKLLKMVGAAGLLAQSLKITAALVVVLDTLIKRSRVRRVITD